MAAALLLLAAPEPTPPSPVGKYGPLPQLNGTEIRACDWESWTRALPKGLELEAAEVGESLKFMGNRSLGGRFSSGRGVRGGTNGCPAAVALRPVSGGWVCRHRPFRPTALRLLLLPQAIYGQGIADAKAWLAEQGKAAGTA